MQCPTERDHAPSPGSQDRAEASKDTAAAIDQYLKDVLKHYLSPTARRVSSRVNCSLPKVPPHSARIRLFMRLFSQIIDKFLLPPLFDRPQPRLCPRSGLVPAHRII